MTPDRIVLTIPRDEGFESVAQLVLAGVAARLNFSYEVVDDLGIALETVLERRGDADELTVELEVGADAVKAVIGPLHGDGLRADLNLTNHPHGAVGPDRHQDLVASQVTKAVVDALETVHIDKDQSVGLAVQG